MSLARHALHPHRVEDVAAIVRDSRGLRIRGAGTWMHAGHPVVAAEELRLDAFAGVRAYTPDDLTITVGAATTLAELDAVTRAHGQWCPLLPWGDDAGSVGATVATASAGPFAAAFGRPRDLVLGLECVDGHGRIVRAGGRVVKNVAGFDLTRLMTGSWGSLGVITELHLRLRARPAVDRTVFLEPADRAALAALLRGPLAPLAAVPLDDALAPKLGRHGRNAWLLRVGGNAATVAATLEALMAIGACTELDPGAWSVVRRELAPPPAASDWPWTPLQRRIKRLFDPRGVLNPGLLGEVHDAA
jgi:glycolate oxidase FAD binding subunit